MPVLDFSDTTGIRREREKLGAGRWAGSLLLLFVAGVPVMLAAHFKTFPDATKPKVIATYASLDEVPGGLFDPETNEPLVRYCGDPEGEVEFVGKDVEYSPTTGERCWPLTAVILRLVRGAEARRLGEGEALRRARETDEAQRAAEEARLAERRRQEAEREEALRAESVFRDRYVNSSALGQLRSGHVALAVSDSGLERTLAQALRGRGVSVSTNVFTDEIFGGGVFSSLAAGDRSLLSRLGLGNGHATLLLGEIEKGPATRTGVGNAVNVRGHLAIHMVPLSGGAPVSLPTVSETGAGFNEEQARSKLYERLTEALLEEPVIGRLGV
jgi:hypothetical protein